LGQTINRLIDFVVLADADTVIPAVGKGIAVRFDPYATILACCAELMRCAFSGRAARDGAKRRLRLRRLRFGHTLQSEKRVDDIPLKRDDKVSSLLNLSFQIR
jgi:hypothetical protein